MGIPKRELKGPVFPPLKTIKGATREINQLQDNVKRATDDARRNVENRHRIIKNVEIVAGQDTLIAHGLGRKPTGYAVVRLITGAPAFTEKASKDARTRRVLILTGSAAGVVDMKVW